MKSFRMLLIGLIAGVSLTISVSAFAAGGVSEISAYLREGFTIKLNGEKVELQNTPIVYKNTSYYPLRELMEKVGYDVGFEDNTITLNAKEPSAEPAATEPEKDVNDVTTTTDQTELEPWVSLDYAEIQGVTIANDGESITFSYGDKEIKFPIPEKDASVGIAGGFNIQKIEGIIYLSRFTLDALLN